MNNYYKTLKIESLDFQYLKTIRKQSRKEELLKPAPLNRAAEILIDNPGNKSIAAIMKSYEDDYRDKFCCDQPANKGQQVSVRKNLESNNKIPEKEVKPGR